MDLVPKRPSLLSEASAILRTALKEGQWGEFMPGERKLCAQMQIGRDTLRLAIQQLEREGLVSAGEPGKRRRILTKPHTKSKGKGRKRVGLVLYLSPYPLHDLPATALLEIDLLRGSLSKAGFRLEVVGSAAFSMGRPEKTLEKLVADHQAICWGFCISRPPRSSGGSSSGRSRAFSTVNPRRALTFRLWIWITMRSQGMRVDS